MIWIASRKAVRSRLAPWDPVRGYGAGAGALAGARSLELRQAERREETARQEEVVKTALRNSATLQEQSRWPEARAALAVLQLPDSAAKEVVERLQRAQKDADMVAELEEIRLRMAAFRSDDPAAFALVKLYADTFDKYGFPLVRLRAQDATARGSRLFPRGGCRPSQE